jgi:hypothetical protein
MRSGRLCIAFARVTVQQCASVQSALALGPHSEGFAAWHTGSSGSSGNRCSTALSRHASLPTWPSRGPRRFSTGTAGGSGSGSDSGSGGASTPEADRAAEQMLQMMERMMSDPSTQQLMLSRLPPHMRRPEVLKAMMANPEVRQRIAGLAQQTVRGRGGFAFFGGGVREGLGGRGGRCH